MQLIQTPSAALLQITFSPQKGRKAEHHLASEDRLRVWGLFSLKKRQLPEDLVAAFQYLKVACKIKIERDFLQGQVVTVKSATVVN